MHSCLDENEYVMLRKNLLGFAFIWYGQFLSLFQSFSYEMREQLIFAMTSIDVSFLNEVWIDDFRLVKYGLCELESY